MIVAIEDITQNFEEVDELYASMFDVDYRIERKKQADWSEEERKHAESKNTREVKVQKKRPVQSEEGEIWIKTQETTWRHVAKQEAERIRKKRANSDCRHTSLEEAKKARKF